MSRFAASVHLVTTDGPAGRRGVTVSSACSVSDDPATLLVCLNTSSPDNARFEANGSFALNLLGKDNEALARAFAGEGKLAPDARFAKGEWHAEETGAPLLVSALAAFDCRLLESRIVATHRVMIGEVVGVRIGPRAPSLVYLDRGYHSL
ncbi:flavin reductase [Aurantimonas sp. VKM B-3413]|uniref:flavin reductase n=1 Tax=Aurantimonas sp. VKM B-3413 TaxID=2779401 RepID=UPI001E2FE559|nr:flavin reductase [Aurantimonas sp. VKM B-3413]MCB8839734.1 flavin reductase [Aurantimonas sp. VKM B-3413]